MSYKSIRSYIIDTNKNKIFIEKYFDENLAQNTCESMLHAEVCNEYAKNALSDFFFHRLCVNVLFFKSNECRLITKIVYTARRKLKIQSLYINEVTSNEFKKVVNKFLPGENIIYKSTKDSNIKFNRKEVLLKCLIHKLFYIFSKVKKFNTKNINILKSWVDISLELYKSEKIDLVYLLPYKLSLYRQFQYVITLYKKKYSFRFIGYNYKLKKILKYLTNPNLYNYVDLEHDASESFYKTHETSGIPNAIFTSDEHEVNSFIHHELFIKHKTRVINKVHGIGKYSPNIVYSNIFLYNDVQESFYNLYSNVPVTYFNKTVETSASFNNEIIYISGVANYKSFSILEEKLLKLLTEISKAKNFKLLIKSHPSYIKNYNNYNTINNLNKNNHNAVYLHIMSTFHYTCEKSFKNIIVIDDVYNGTDTFGKTDDCMTLSDIKLYFENFS